MKKTLFLVVSLMIVFLLVNAVIAAKPPPEPGYSGMPLKALNTCLEACGKAPDSADLPAMAIHERCRASCHDKIIEIEAAIAAEEAARIAGDAALQAALNQEILDRIADIDAEETRAIAAELELQYNLNEETATRIAADIALQDALNTEITDRTTDVDNEEAARIADVDAEETRALAAEYYLEEDLNTLAAIDALDYDECSDLDNCGYLTSVSWGDILSIPTGFADGIDDDTVPTTADIEALGFTTGPHTVDTDTNAETICPAGTYLNGDGTCDLASNIVSVGGGLTVEDDPQVELVTNGMWCRGTGSTVTCDQNAPTCDCDLTAVWAYIAELEERILALEEACEPSTEVCDGVDNDCDGLIDENFLDLNDICYAGLGVCQSSGVMVCNAAKDGTECSAAPGTPTETPETTCNDGLDNDCDGNADCDDTDCTGDPDCTSCIDNDGDGYYEENPSCAGSNDCDDWDSDVHPGATEQCNGADDDCDGIRDEDNPESGGACDTGLPGVCAAGTLNCRNAELWCDSDTSASPEVCDGLDNDCNNVTDDGSSFDLCPQTSHVSLTACSGGSCQIVACDSGYADCNGLYADGCEIDIYTNVYNCGSCGYACSAGQTCDIGICVGV